MRNDPDEQCFLASCEDCGLEWIQPVDGAIACPRCTLLAAREREALLRDRLKLVDRVCYSHHVSWFMPEEYHECPICRDEGGINFYGETERLITAALAAHGGAE